MGRSPFRDAIMAAVFVTPVLLAAIEFALFLGGYNPWPDVRLERSACFVEFGPNVHVRDERDGLVHDLWLDSNGFRVDADELRGEKVEPSPACRVLALGDSFTEGMYVDASETWPSQLEAILRRRGYDVRVDNGGFRARSIAEQRYAALERWGSLRHDLVVLEHTGNDIEEHFNYRRNGCVEPRFSFLGGWRIYRLANEVAIQLRGDRQAFEAKPSRSDCFEAAADYRELLLDTVRVIRADDRDFLFVRMAPFFCTPLGDRGAIWETYTEELTLRLRELDVARLDVYEELSLPGRDLLPADSHPNAVAYAAIAKRIADQIVASAKLERCRNSD